MIRLTLVSTKRPTAAIQSPAGGGAAANLPSGQYATKACDPNISVDPATTTCGLAENAFKAYAQAIKSGGVNATVQAMSPASGQTYTLNCSAPQRGVSCTGGKSIYITFPLHAAQIY